MLGRILPDLLRDLHAAEFGAAHAAEVGDLGRLLGQRLVVEGPRRHRVQRQVELVVPPEVEARMGQLVVPHLSHGVLLRQVCSVGRNLVRDDPLLDVVAVGQAEVFLWGHVAEEGGAELGDPGGPNGGGDVVVAGGNVQSERPKGVKRGLPAPLELLLHVLRDLVHGHVPRALVHDLNVLLPRPRRQLALHRQLTELRQVVGVSDAPGPQPVTDGDGDVVLPADVEDIVPVLVREVLLVLHEGELGVDGPAARYDARHTLGCVRNEAQEHSGVDGEVVHPLLRLLDQRLPEQLPRDLHRVPASLLQSLVDGDGADGNGGVPHDPLPRLVDVLARGEVHQSVRTPHGGPLELLDLLLDGAADGGVADVGVDLDLEVAPHDHRLELEVLLVGWDDGAAPSHLAANKFRIHALPCRHVGHLLRHDPALGVVHLREALVAAALPLANPVGANGVKPVHWVHVLGTGGVVDVQVRPPRAFRQVDAAERHLEGLAVVLDGSHDFLGVREALLESRNSAKALHLAWRIGARPLVAAPLRRRGSLSALEADPAHARLAPAGGRRWRALAGAEALPAPGRGVLDLNLRNRRREGATAPLRTAPRRRQHHSLTD
mmetsp:Transcript_10926/g.27584  ORF Transcript_10926/g.27584 Transcript_10926/m.27584 type:complete len:604 (-) Transcript_10926:142-1953(-)